MLEQLELLEKHIDALMQLFESSKKKIEEQQIDVDRLTLQCGALKDEKQALEDSLKALSDKVEKLEQAQDILSEKNALIEERNRLLEMDAEEIRHKYDALLARDEQVRERFEIILKRIGSLEIELTSPSSGTASATLVPIMESAPSLAETSIEQAE